MNVRVGLSILLCIVIAVSISCGAKKKITIQSLNRSEIQKKTTPLISTRNGKKDERSKIVTCKSIEDFYYDPEHPEYHTFKRIRVNVHFVNSKDSTHNFNPNTGIEFAKYLVYHANKKLKKQAKMNLPEGNDTPVYPVPYEYVLTPDGNKPGDTGVYFHYLDDPFFINGPKKANNYDRKILDTLNVNRDSVLNIFYMVHHPDSISSKTYKGEASGIALGKSVKLGINFARPADPWTYSGLLNHEIGHVLGLSHAWNKNDGCDDTPPHPNCWSSGSAPCDGPISNNVMDYNSIQMAYTPCQIARAYRLLSRYDSPKRDLVLKDWCKYNKEKDITITDTTVWRRAMDLSGNVIIQDGATLVISCHTQMAEGSYIKVYGGGTLILKNATIYNDCDYLWDGIIRVDSKANPANIEYIDTFYLENVLDPSI